MISMETFRNKVEAKQLSDKKLNYECLEMLMHLLFQIFIPVFFPVYILYLCALVTN